MRYRLRIGAVLCLALGLSAPLASAQEAPVTDLAAEAELHFQIAVGHYRDRQYQDALEHLLLSNRLSPNQNVTFNIARCYELLEQPADAYRHYTDFLLVSANDAQRASAEQALKRLTPQLALVEIVSDPPGTLVYVERRDLGVRGQTPRTFALPAGPQELILEQDGYAPQTVSVDLKRGAVASVSVELEQYLGEVVLTGSPVGAEVRLDGSDAVLGTLPVTLRLPEGPQLLSVSAPGHQAQTLLTSVALDAQTELFVSLQQVTNAVLVESSERGARIELDGALVGFTPAMVDVPLGEHALVISADGFRPHVEELVVRRGDEQRVSARLLPVQEVTVASGVKENLADAPASMVVLTRADILARGYTDLAEVMSDLPGFDVTVANGTTYIGAYQRGYRTPFTQRTLLMIDGIIDNHLWTHEAVITRQYPLSNIERIEVLYGPASAVYGPNAFLGIINIVTRDGSGADADSSRADIRAHVGSFETRSADGAIEGRVGGVSYALAGRIFRSDEADLSRKWGFLSNALYSDETIWGPMLDQEHRNTPLGSYQDPTDDWAVMGRLSAGGAEVGVIDWTRKEGYGPYYAADRAQNNTTWNKSSRQVFGRYTASLGPSLVTRTLLLYRQNRVWGGWIEGAPDGEGALISYTHWNSVSDSWLFRQRASVDATDWLSVQGGLKFERKELAKSYDIPGYWEGSYTGSGVEPGSGIGSSADETYDAPPIPNAEMHPENLALTNDVGGFVQGIADLSALRLNAGIRYDHNSLYGQSVNPRASAILRALDGQLAVKAMYGEAFQEPAPIQLWGGWEGRAANPDLRPEKARNAEGVVMFITPTTTNEVSVYRAGYEDVIKEEAENAGERTVFGVEYRNRTRLENPIPESAPISLYANYTLTQSTSSITYNHTTAVWDERASALGDIAPHKVNAGVTVPVRWVQLHLRGNWVSERELYSHNPLRAAGETLPAYTLLNGVVSTSIDALTLSLKVNNLLDTDYFHPGMEQADAGNDFSARSLGYRNSVLPQPGRNVLLSGRLAF